MTTDTSGQPGLRVRSTSATRRVAKNTLFLAASDGANKVMMFLFNLIVARRLGVSDYGVLSLSLAFVTMLAVLTDLGLGAVTAREVARDETVAERLVGNGLGIKLVASVIVMALLVVAANLLGYPPSTLRVIYICSLFVVGNAMSSYYCYVFQGLERMELVALNRMAQAVVLVVGAVIISHLHARVEHYALLYACAWLVALLVAAANAADLFRTRVVFAFGEWWRLLRSAAPVGLAVVFTTAYYWNGTMLLSKLRNDESVGAYSAAFRLAMGLAFIGFAFSNAVYPLLARLKTDGSERLAPALQLALKYSSYGVFAVMLLAVVFASDLTLLAYGPGYLGSAVVLRVLLLWGGLACVNSLLSNYFLAVDQAAVVAIQCTVSLAVNVVGNVLLISAFGAVGAGISIACAEAAGVVYLIVRQSRTATGVSSGRLFVLALRLFAALGSAVAVAVALYHWHLLLALGLACVTYLLVLVVSHGINARDLEYVRMLVRRDGD